jgi:hypothetical protein
MAVCARLHKGVDLAMTPSRPDVERVGGAVVLTLDQLPEVADWSALLSSGTARGGFMPALA